jgi:outer membrane protein OmpA-like peptidoglycan-associated protein
MPDNMKKSSILIMMLMMMAIPSALAQQGENLVRNGTFEDEKAGFKRDSCIGREDFSFFITKNRFSYISDRGKGYGICDSLEWFIRQYEKIEDTSGYFLLTWDIMARGNTKFWYDSITIKPNTTYSFSCIVSNVYWGTTPKVYWGTTSNPCLGAPWFSFNPGMIKLCVNEKKISRWLSLPYSNEWRTLSGTFTSGPDQTRIEISITNGPRNTVVAVDNIVFKEIQPGEYEKEFAKKEERFPKLGDKAGVVGKYPPPAKKEKPVIETLPLKREEPVAEPFPVKKEEPVIEIPPVKEEEPIAVITPPVKKEESVVEISPVKEEEAVVEILPKREPSVVISLKEKASAIIPPKAKPSIVIQPKKKPSVVITPKPAKKDTATQLVAVSADFKKDISIDEIKVDQKLQLSHIYFEQGKFNLLAASMPELNELVTFMKKYPTVRIRLEGHTDNQGNPERNVELSENRAKEVKKYLVEQGIDENRIEWIGYGGQRPVYSNADKNLRPKNRRVEVVIIGK